MRGAFHKSKNMPVRMRGAGSLQVQEHATMENLFFRFLFYVQTFLQMAEIFEGAQKFAKDREKSQKPAKSKQD